MRLPPKEPGASGATWAIQAKSARLVAGDMIPHIPAAISVDVAGGFAHNASLYHASLAARLYAKGTDGCPDESRNC